MAFLEMKNVEKEFGSIRVLRGVNLEVNEHQVVCLIGHRVAGSPRYCAVSMAWKKFKAAKSGLRMIACLAPAST
jgi:ABC-type branched-subunit amino acid transport system ATPase component